MAEHLTQPNSNSNTITNKRKLDDLYLDGNSSSYSDYYASYSDTYPSKKQATNTNNVINDNNNSFYLPAKASSFSYQPQEEDDTLKKVTTTPTATNNNVNTSQQQQSKSTQYSTSPASTTTATTSPIRPPVNLNYINEIANFAANDVKLAMSSRIDDETGEIYGPLGGEYQCGYTFHSLSELNASGVHRTNAYGNFQSNSPLISYHEDERIVDNQKVYNIKPASSVLIYDTDDHDDRGNVILFSSPYKVQITNGSTNGAPVPDRGNKALVKNMQSKIPVRVIRARDNNNNQQNNGPNRNNSWGPNSGYRYDGVYFVCDFWHEKFTSNYDSVTYSFVFKLVRIYGQPQLPTYTNVIMNQTHVVHQPRVVMPQANQPDRIPYNMGLVDSPQLQQQQQPQQYQYGNYMAPTVQQSTTYRSYNTTTTSTLPQLPLSNAGYSYAQQSSPMPSQQQPQQQYSPMVPLQQPQQPQQPQQTQQQQQQQSSGVQLSHDKIRQMLDDLKNKNTTFSSRMDQYKNNINSLDTKYGFNSVDTGSSHDHDSSKIVTSRNKEFFWKLNGKEPPAASRKSKAKGKGRAKTSTRKQSTSGSSSSMPQMSPPQINYYNESSSGSGSS